MSSPTGSAVPGQSSRCETKYAVGAKTLGGGSAGGDAYGAAQSDSVFNSSGRFPVKTNEKCDDRLLLPHPRQCPCAPPLSNSTPGAWRVPCHLPGQLHSLWREAGLGCVPSRTPLGLPPVESVSRPVGSHGTLHWGHCETGVQSEARNQNCKGQDDAGRGG